jgi:hypothetical protein
MLLPSGKVWPAGPHIALRLSLRRVFFPMEEPTRQQIQGQDLETAPLIINQPPAAWGGLVET